MMSGIVFETSVFVRPPSNNKSAFQNPPFADSFRKSAFLVSENAVQFTFGRKAKTKETMPFFQKHPGRLLVEVALFEWPNLMISSQKLELTYNITDFENIWLNY